MPGPCRCKPCTRSAEAGLYPRSAARATAHLLGDLYLLLRPENGLFELYFQVVAEVVSLPRFPTLGAPEEIAEKITEYIIEVPAEAEIIESSRSVLRPEAIEIVPFFGVAENLVGEVYLLEFLFCFLIAVITVRMVREGELPVGLLYFLIGGVL